MGESSKPAKLGSKWTLAECDQLREEIKTLSVAEIATRHERTVGSITTKLAHYAAVDSYEKKIPVADVAATYKVSEEAVLGHLTRKAIAEVVNGRMSTETAAQTYGVPVAAIAGVDKRTKKTVAPAKEPPPPRTAEETLAVVREIRDMMRQICEAQKRK